MDNKTFEQVEIPKSITGEQYKLLKKESEEEFRKKTKKALLHISYPSASELRIEFSLSLLIKSLYLWAALNANGILLNSDRSKIPLRNKASAQCPKSTVNLI